jgi:transposase
MPNIVKVAVLIGSGMQTGKRSSLRKRKGGREKGKRCKTNMISAITNRGRLYFIVFRKRFNWKVFTEFLPRLIKQVPHRVFLIVDEYVAHVDGPTKRWLKTHKERIRIFFLPPYRPELNPNKYLNQDVKSNALGRRRPRDFREMEAHLRGYLRSTQKMPAVVRRFFRHPKVRYAA